MTPQMLSQEAEKRLDKGGKDTNKLVEADPTN
jgi:hypothetical protein